MSAAPKLFLLDAMALIYRAYFALNKNPRINTKGLNTSAILGFTNTLFDVLLNERPSHIAVCFDSHAPTLRADEHSFYKANREAMPDDISLALPYIQQLIEALNIPILALEGYEADDIIGTLAKQAEKEGFQVYMMTTDKDFGQLVSDNIFIYKPGRGGEKATVHGVKEVCEKYSIQHPLQLIDILGIWGDASDNIPGIPGAGEVTAKKLIAEFGSMENLLEKVDTLKPSKLKDNIIAYRQQAIESKALATIILDVPVSFNHKAFELSAPDTSALKTLFDELEFRNIGQRILASFKSSEEVSYTSSSPTTDNADALHNDATSTNPVRKTSKDIPHNYLLISKPDDIVKMIETLCTYHEVCFDTETTGLDANASELVGISFSAIAHEGYFVYLPENYQQAYEYVHLMKPFFENTDILKIGQNIKYDIEILKWYDIEVKGPLFDTMIAHYLLEPDLRHNMDLLAETYLNYSPISIETLIGKKGKDQLSMRFVHPDELCEYACEDADITLQLKNLFAPMLENTQTRSIFETVEMPLLPVLVSMETEGVRIDTSILKDISTTLEKELEAIEEAIIKEAGVPFNIASPKQLGEVIYDHLKIIDKPKLTKTKQYATGEDVLQKLINKHPIVSMILDYRELAKLKSTYIDSLPLLINKRTGRIHTSFNQAVAATGRLSSTNPNLQNIPIRTERGREIRKAFVARNDEYTFLSADYSQIELRIMAEMSGEQNMLQDFRNGLDIHTATAARVYNLSLDQVTNTQRRNAKTVNFGIIYGISAFGLSERLSIPRHEAAEIIRQYFAMYPAIKAYMDATLEGAREKGYVETLLGRKRYIRDIHAANSVVRGYAERNAINAPIQGSAADMIKVAMINIHQAMQAQSLRSRMLLQVHDELNFDVFIPEISTMQSIVKEQMCNAMPNLSVPIEIDMKTGNNWFEAH